MIRLKSKIFGLVLTSVTLFSLPAHASPYEFVVQSLALNNHGDVLITTDGEIPSECAGTVVVRVEGDSAGVHSDTVVQSMFGLAMSGFYAGYRMSMEIHVDSGVGLATPCSVLSMQILKKFN